MSVGIEIITYGLLIVGMLIMSITFFNNENLIQDGYIKNETNDRNIEVVLHITGESDEQTKKIEWMIEKGTYKDIYDIADKYTVIYEKD